MSHAPWVNQQVVQRRFHQCHLHPPQQVPDQSFVGVNNEARCTTGSRSEALPDNHYHTIGAQNCSGADPVQRGPMVPQVAVVLNAGLWHRLFRGLFEASMWEHWNQLYWQPMHKQQVIESARAQATSKQAEHKQLVTQVARTQADPIIGSLYWNPSFNIWVRCWCNTVLYYTTQ